MTNFIIAPTLTMGIQSTLPGVTLATNWPLDSVLAKIENFAEDTNHVYHIQSDGHNHANLMRVLEAIDESPYAFEMEEVSL